MGNPSLLQELPDIPSLVSEGGGDGEQARPADCAVCRLEWRQASGLSAPTDWPVRLPSR